MSSIGEVCEEGGFTFIWRIKNFKHCLVAKGSYLESARFYMADLNTTWYLLFYPRGKANDATKSECKLKRTTSNIAISFNCKMCVCTTSGEVVCMNEKTNARIESQCLTSATLFDRFIDDSFPHDTLVFHCHLWKINSIPDTPLFCHSETQIKVQRKASLWKIPKFSSLLLKKENVFTLMKVESTCPNLTFKVSLRGSTIDDASLHIIIHFDGVNRKTFFTCNISLVDNTDTSMKFMYTEDWLENGDQLSFFPHFLTRRELMTNKESYLPDDVLSLMCEVTISDGNHTIDQVVHGKSTLAVTNTVEKSSPSHPQISKDNGLRSDLGLFYDRGTLCDFELTAGGRAFPVHRIILSARSPVFRAMFENDMLEKVATSLVIPDLDSNTLDQMVRYIYTDEVPDLNWKDASLLYFAADKYQLLALKAQCSTLLHAQLDITNAIKILVLADRHQDGDLKELVWDFLFNCGREAFNAEDWKLLEVENPQLAIETLRRILY